MPCRECGWRYGWVRFHARDPLPLFEQLQSLRAETRALNNFDTTLNNFEQLQQRQASTSSCSDIVQRTTCGKQQQLGLQTHKYSAKLRLLLALNCLRLPNERGVK